MKQIRNISLLLLALLIAFGRLAAQDRRTLETKVADLLVRVPAHDQQQLDHQMQSLLSLGEEGWQMVMDLVIQPGTGDDTNARVAIESLSRYLSQPGKDAARKRWEALILREVDTREETAVKRFFISQLYYSGSTDAIEQLKKYLTDPNLQDPAIRAIREISPDEVAALCAGQLVHCEGRTQIALVNVLKETGNSTHADAVAALAGSDDDELQRSVLACLAELGNPGSYDLLSDAALNAGYRAEPTGATASLIAYAKRLSDRDMHDLSLKICKNLLKKCNGQDQVHFRSGALVTAAGNEPVGKSVSLLVKAMKDDDKQFRMTAIRYAAANNSPLDPWFSAIKGTRNSEVKAEILSLFGMMKSEEAADVAYGYMNDPDAAVRQQAVMSVALIENSLAVPEIISYIRSYPGAPDSETAREALLQTVTMEQLPLLTSGLEGAHEGAKVVLIEVIASKGDPGSFELLYGMIGQPGAVRSAVLNNLYLVSDQWNLNDLMNLYDRLNDQEEISDIEKALVAAIDRGPQKNVAVRSLLSHATENSTVENYIGVLAKVGGEEALETVYDAYVNGDREERQKALNGLLESDDMHAIHPLFKICSRSTVDRERSDAFKRYLRLVSSSSLPDDQKLLLIRKIEPYAAGADGTKQLIRAMGSVKTFLSFVTLSHYLGQEEVKTQAANALVGVALPGDGMDNGLTGDLVREKLMIAKEVIGGPDSEYLKIDLQDYLDKMPPERGFVPLFNGSDLSGWQGLAADPVERAGLSPGELKQLQEEANEKLKENWSVRDGCIVFNGNGSNLCTIRQYGDFELIVDWRITRKGDSGIYLRGAPQVQIWDTSRVEVGAQVGSGGLYNNQVNESSPLLVADNPVGDWNTFHITMQGERVTVYLNGELVVDNVVMENYWDRNIPIYPAGSIELQAHGTDLAFRDIYVKELENDHNTLTEEEKAEGFVSLFNGRDLTNWTGNQHSYTVEDGTIVIRPAESGGNLYTEKEYADFIFRFEFRLTPGANNGLGVRTPMEGDAAYVGYELQILDNTAPEYAHLQPYQYHGSVYGIIPARRGFLKPVGEWNSEEVYLNGDRIRIILNGTTIVDGDLKEATRNGTADHREHPGLGRTSGHIGFLGHGSELWFRNIRIREL